MQLLSAALRHCSLPPASKPRILSLLWSRLGRERQELLSGLFALARCKVEAPCRILAASFLLVACDLPSQVIEKLCDHLKLIQVFFQIQDFSWYERVHCGLLPPNSSDPAKRDIPAPEHLGEGYLGDERGTSCVRFAVQHDA
jgi:hypothetical protein